MKVWNYMMIMLTMMIFLSFLGLAPTGTTEILNNMSIGVNTTTGDVQGDLTSSGWFNFLFNATTGALLAIGIGGAVIVGFFTKSFDWRIVLIGFFTAFVAKFVSMGWSMIQLAQSTGQTWLVWIIFTVFVPLTAMFIFSIVEWFGGTE